MRGVGPVMSPMSKSFRKRERSSGVSRNVKNSSSSTANGASPSKKPRLTVTDCSGDPPLEKQQQQQQEQHPQHESTTTSSPALSGASSLSTSNPKVGAASVSSPSTPDRPGQWSLRPRQSSGGIVKRTRRLYYDVHLTEDDATKLLGHRIKMWWPLDKRWYLGEIKNYDSELRQHWIVYDDGDKEWVKLEEENFRLQLLPGDSFERAAKPRSSTYCLNSEKEEDDADNAADVCSQPSSRTGSEDISSAQNVVLGPSVRKPVSVYTRRRHSRNGSGSGSVPVTSAASTVETDTIEVQSPIRVCEPSNTALSFEDQEVTFGEAEAELGIMVEGVEQPGPQEVRMVEGGSIGTTPSPELLSDRQLCTTPGEVQETRDRMVLSKKISHLRKIFHIKWKDLCGPGLRLSINESLGLFSSRHLFILLRIQRLNTQAILLRASACQVGTTGSTETRPGLQELLSMSKKGRRTIKGIKRISQEEGLPLPPPKRIRIAVPEPAPVTVPPTLEEQPSQDDGKYSRGNILKLRKCPTKRGAMWCVATSTESVYDDLAESPSSGTCTANLLIVQSDRGWRETGATIEQQADGDTSMLVVSLNGEVLYTYKAYQPIQAGISNKHTHALMWRGGKDWMLEFTDKLQWNCFRSMHAASCETNARALSMKHIPIPGVREVPDSSDPLDSFFRPWGSYIKQPSGEIDAALSTSRVLYDMDSEDEEWLDTHDAEITEEVFEKTIHYLERAAYLQKQEEISLPFAVELCSSFAPADAISLIHAHWLERRKQHGMALIRCFQAAACDRYEAALQAWKDSLKQTDQPAVFAFCMRPNGSHKMSRQRSQRRISHVDHQYLDELHGLRNGTIEPFDSEFYSGSPGSDAFEDGSYGTPSQRLLSRSKGRKPGKRPRRMKSISGGDERRGLRTFIAPATAMNLGDDGDQFDGGDSCSSMDFDLNDDALAKAQLARKAARIAASKAARAQELYAVADAAMKRAVACLIEAEALAAAEKAGRDKLEQQQQQQGVAVEEIAEEIEDDDDLLLPISNWTQEFGSGLIQKGGGDGEALVASPRKSLRYVNQSSLFKGMVS